MSQISDLLKRTSGETTPSADAQNSSSKTAVLLMDLKLQVRILFGRTHLRLKELLKLGPGSIVELDRRPDDTVELVVNNRVIARGQVVVVDGCYGIRITEILRRSEAVENPSVADLMSLFENIG